MAAVILRGDIPALDQYDADMKVVHGYSSFLPFVDLLDEAEVDQDGAWAYLKTASCVAESICAPHTLHENTVKEVVRQLREVRKHSRLVGPCRQCSELRAEAGSF